jgi:hypothetical protein
MAKAAKATETAAPAPDTAAMQQLDRHPGVAADFSVPVDGLYPTPMPGGELRDMRQMLQAPSLGRIVLYTPPEGEETENAAPEYVAIIGQVFTDADNKRPYCNLLVFPPFAAPRWEGSVQEGDPAGAAFRTWRWPTRIA